MPRNTPKRIWLCLGDDVTANSDFSEYDSGEVTWCDQSIWSTDVEYVRADLYRRKVRELARLRVTKQ